MPMVWAQDWVQGLQQQRQPQGEQLASQRSLVGSWHLPASHQQLSCKARLGQAGARGQMEKQQRLPCHLQR
jgi:hypothetical protein